MRGLRSKSGGIVAGLISFIPYLGATTGVVMAVVAALVQAQQGDDALIDLRAVVDATAG